MAHITILLGLYNGQRFLSAQLDSLLAQTHADWRVVARDDGSTDDTVALYRDFMARYPQRFDLAEDQDGNLGVRGNFSRLMEQAPPGWFMFCDQDDVWLPNKLELFAARMAQEEARLGAQTPILLYSGMVVVDADLNPVERQELAQPRYRGCDQFPGLVMGCPAAGCSSMGNAALLELARAIPQDWVYHDWWTIQVAAATGYVIRMDQQTVYYRQHGGNVVGVGTARGEFGLFRKPHWWIATLKREVGRRHHRLSLVADRAGTRMTPAAAREIDFILRGRGWRRLVLAVQEWVAVMYPAWWWRPLTAAPKSGA